MLWNMPEILATLAALIYATILVFLLWGLLRIRNKPQKHRPTISIVVAAKNEENHLPACLRALARQSYPVELTQVVVVNDRSTDATAAILKGHSTRLAHLKTVDITNTPNGISPKKHALQTGIANATGELIFTTDADCTPPPQWISETLPLFDQNVGMVVGLAPLLPGHSLLSRLLSLDSLATAFVSAGAIGWNCATTCAGRNLAYRKEAFEEVGGFQSINHSLSGDDDLFLQLLKKRTSWNAVVSLNVRTVVPSPAPESLVAFFAQKRRHVSAGKYYSRPLQLVYLLYHLANGTLWAFLFASFLRSHFIFLASLLFGAKLFLDFLALYLTAQKLNLQRLLVYFPAWEAFFILTQLFVAPLAFVGKVKWK
ncbi:MAG: glycosyltransferase [bacterium]